MYIAAETPPIPLEDGTVTPSTGLAGLGNGIAWRPALKAAMMLAIPAGVLSAQMTPIGLICMVGAAVWAVSLYARSARSTGISMGTGARIGLVTGLIASWLALTVSGVHLWADRFILRQGSQVDAGILAPIQMGLDFDKQFLAQMGVANNDAALVMQRTQASMLSAEGRAGYVLSAFLVSAVFLIFFATIGGAVGARFVAQPRRPNA